jgi:hypothetical protein
MELLDTASQPLATACQVMVAKHRVTVERNKLKTIDRKLTQK